MCLWSNCFSKIDAGALVRFINRGKRSEMVSVVSRYERNEIWIEYIYFLFINSCTMIPKLPYFLGKYSCSIKLKTLLFGVFQMMRRVGTDAHWPETHVFFLGPNVDIISNYTNQHNVIWLIRSIQMKWMIFQWLQYTPKDNLRLLKTCLYLNYPVHLP